MAYFLACDYSQSYIFDRQISSFGWLVANYNNQPDLLINEMSKTLQILFDRYFNAVRVECSDATQPDSPSQFILAIYVEFQTSDGTISNISRLAEINGSKFTLISNVITGGEVL
ncbi:MAG TPA: hypothetical protein VN843_00575 [Anaerolineales bacterium]|nr:hypothetical protein [Anaerolineales bacterium]